MKTHAVTFSGSDRPTEFPLRSRSLLRPNRERVICSICENPSPISHTMRCEVKRRGTTYEICGRCNKKFHDAPGQIERFGFRFRLVERSEMPRTAPIAKQIYKILLLAKERSEIRQKEVNWMPQEQTDLIIKLPVKLAKIVGKTYAVCGDGAKLADDEALTRIRDLLDEIDPEIISRNKNKRLT